MEQRPEKDDIDELLDQEDPEFRKELAGVAEVQTEVELDADGAIEEFSENDFEEDDEAPKSRWSRINHRLRSGLGNVLHRLKLSATRFVFEFLIFVKTKPRELLGFLGVQLKVLVLTIKGILGKYSRLPRAQKGLVFCILLLSGLVGYLTLKNLKGVWLPVLNPPVITTLSEVADNKYVSSIKESEMFYRAFPRSPDLFLFEKFKVNLKPTAGHPNPMGAFEVVVEFDSKDAAVEAQSRQVEFHDLIQREFESQTYPSMLTDLGKQQLKNLIKSQLDDLLSQGWVEQIHFQTFILKP